MTPWNLESNTALVVIAMESACLVTTGAHGLTENPEKNMLDKSIRI